MKDEDIKKLKGTLDQLDHGIISLSEVAELMEKLVSDEEGELEEADDIDSDKMVDRREKCEALREAVDKLYDMLSELGEIKQEIEGY